MSPVPHPSWCDTTVCEAGALGGLHRSATSRIKLRRGNEPPTALVMLVATVEGLTRIRLVVIGDTLINEVAMTLDEAHLLSAILAKLVEQAAPADR